MLQHELQNGCDEGMNKQGHVATAAFTGSAMVALSPLINIQAGFLPLSLFMGLAVVGGLAPDIDHKSSTASQIIQLSRKKRKWLRGISISLIIVGAVLLGLQAGLPIISLHFPLHSQMELISRSWPLWMGAGLLAAVLARLRVMVLTGIGALLLVGYMLYDWHWIASFAGLSLLLVPLLSHRGFIHTPEFGLILTVGLTSFASEQTEIVLYLALGFLTGWWTHLIADSLGSEGIHSQIVPKLKLALRLVKNGSRKEKKIAHLCWVFTIAIWTMILVQLAY
jgi:hypothetical protein